ncbi:phosphodiesterase [Methylobacterium sp. C33D]
MRIISHRGFWKAPEEKNTRRAFDRTLAEGFGTETDVRDHCERLVVSHDPPNGSAIPWSEVVDAFDGSKLPLAVNIKSDGLIPLLNESFAGRAIEWFAFDMSGPETIKYHRAGLPFFTRHSDIEKTPLLYEEADGIWLDAFVAEWIDERAVREHLANGKSVCIVSSELHGRDPDQLWPRLAGLVGAPGVTLCTDRPDQARQVFRT